jgi:membrane-bound metal-dependent hydrolase YbcI (DUF457 family)
MMGRSHALTGWCAGLGLAAAVGADSLHQAVVIAAVTAGFALLPDLDHPGARASRLLGPLTGALSWLLRRASASVYQLTKGPRDERRIGTHRHLTHTVLFAAALGAATAIGTDAGGAYAVAGVTLFALLLAECALGDWLLPVSVAGVVSWSVTTPGLFELGELSGVLGFAVACGCVVHCLGDAATESGCPFLWPIPIAGETWYELRPPRFLRFRTGKAVEQLLVFPAFAVLAVLLLPGMLDALERVVDTYVSTTDASSP